jgi:hypothetical protein
VKTSVPILDKDRPLASQLLPRVQQSHRNLAALEAEIAGLSLDALLDDGGAAADQRRQLVEKLIEAKAEHDRLVDGYRVSLDRDEQSEAAAAISVLGQELASYEAYAAARVAAMQDFHVATAQVEEALKRLTASANLLQHDTPCGTRLPKGYKIDQTLATTEAIAAENEFLVRHVRALVARIISFKRDGRDTGEAA